MLHHDIPVVALEEFLTSAQQELPALMDWYWGLIATKSGVSPRGEANAGEIVTEREFLKAMRLNPGVRLHYVSAVRPEEVLSDMPHDQSRDGPPGNGYVRTFPGEPIRAIEVLSTFSDEPDWGMDQDLFLIREYSYGRRPFGSATGVSSQAPFHMAFLHESRLAGIVLPRLAKSFMLERIEIFLALAKLAFDKGIDYWGWRFLAWAMHYLQDLTQPYHAYAFPPSRMGMLRGFVFSAHFRGFSRISRNYLKNRHMLFEAIVHFMLNDAVKNQTNHPFLRALAGEADSFPESLDEVIKEAGRIPARLARRIDSVMVRLIDDPRIDDVNYALEDDPNVRIDQVFPEAAAERPHLLDEFVELVCACLSQTGRVTRYTVNLVN